jgi:outer membrane protein OmpA-like peptidoglycan-associated protein/tetratricopeptide (TPR) repeat protein
MHFQLRYQKGFILLFSCILCCTNILLGQNKIAVQNYNAGINALDNKDFQKAIQLFTLAASKDSLYVDPAIALFQVYHEQKDFEKAILYFNQIKKIDTAACIPFLVKQGIALASLGQYNTAYNLLEPYFRNNSLPNYLKDKANALYGVCQFAINQNIAPEISIQNMGDSINSPASEYFPTVSIQDSLFLFMRRQNLSREDFYVSNMGTNGFSAAIPLSDTLNFAAKKGSMSLSADLQTLYYAADYAEQGYGRYDIYKVQRSPWGWSKPKNLGQNINSDYWESAPSIAPDGNSIYFASNRPNGIGGIDIYVSYKNEKGFWEEAVNLGPSINTKGDDQTPFIHADNQSLYFSSNGRAGFGGSDIYVSRKKIDGNWTTPINLGYPINTYDNEGSIAVASNGSTAYIASDRADSRGELDIYKINLAENTRAFKTWYIKGQIIDAKTKKTIAGELQIVDPASGYPMMEIQIDSTGQFLLALPYFDSLGLKINSPGHDYLSSILPIESLKNMAGKTFDFALTPIEKEFTKTFNQVYFASNSAILQNISNIELDALVNYLKSTLNAHILIEGHTDNMGTDARNKLLSFERANAIGNYLQQKGIAANRIELKGLGASKPIADNNTAAGRAKNRRISFTITLK